MRKLGDKKGQGLQLSTIILIVLGIAVLVFLIFGFYTGWSNLWDRITNFAGGKANLDTIKQGCAVACTGQYENDWCSEQRTVRFGKEVTIGGEKVKTSAGTCNDFVKGKNSDDYEAAGLVVTPCAIECRNTNVVAPTPEA
jgi:hypothetical protein